MTRGLIHQDVQLLVVHMGAFMHKQGRFQENDDYSALQKRRQRFCGALQTYGRKKRASKDARQIVAYVVATGWSRY